MWVRVYMYTIGYTRVSTFSLHTDLADNADSYETRRTFPSDVKSLNGSVGKTERAW